jgi:hypothetical protein
MGWSKDASADIGRKFKKNIIKTFQLKEADYNGQRCLLGNYGASPGLWQHRNNKAHANDKENEWTKLNEEVEAQLQQGQQGITSLETLFSEREQERLTGQNLGYIRSWLRNVKARRRRHEQQTAEDGDIVSMREIMQRFLHIT